MKFTTTPKLDFRQLPVALATAIILMAAIRPMATDSQAASAPQFEVASIKLASPSAGRPGRLTRMEAIIETSPGLLSARNAAPKELRALTRSITIRS